MRFIFNVVSLQSIQKRFEKVNSEDKLISKLSSPSHTLTQRHKCSVRFVALISLIISQRICYYYDGDSTICCDVIIIYSYIRSFLAIDQMVVICRYLYSFCFCFHGQFMCFKVVTWPFVIDHVHILITCVHLPTTNTTINWAN